MTKREENSVFDGSNRPSFVMHGRVLPGNCRIMLKMTKYFQYNRFHILKNTNTSTVQMDECIMFVLFSPSLSANMLQPDHRFKIIIIIILIHSGYALYPNGLPLFPGVVKPVMVWHSEERWRDCRARYRFILADGCESARRAHGKI